MKKTLSIVIPVYNESTRLGKTFAALEKLSLPELFTLETIIFVDDGSTDTTTNLIKNSPLHKKFAIKILSYRENRGKGYAVRQGMLASKADYTLLTDADISTPLEELDKFTNHVKNTMPVIIGTRKNGQSTVIVHQPLYREVLGKCFTKLSQIILNTWVTDFTCGFKLFSYEAAQTLFSKAQIDQWGYDSEIIFLAKKNHYPIIEVPVRWSNDSQTKVHLIHDSLQSLYELITIRKIDLAGHYSSNPTPSVA